MSIARHPPRSATASVISWVISPVNYGIIGGFHHRTIGRLIVTIWWQYGDNIVTISWLPSGKLLHNYGKIHHFQSENPLFLLSFSIAMLNYQGVDIWKNGLELSNFIWCLWEWSIDPKNMLFFFENLMVNHQIHRCLICRQSQSE